MEELNNLNSFEEKNHAYVRAANYGANNLLMHAARAANDYPYLKLSAVQSPSSTYMIMDAGNFQAYPREAVTPGESYNYIPGMGALGADGSNLGPRYKSDFETGRHFGGVNVNFADGHAKWVKASTIYTEAKKMMDARSEVYPKPTSPAMKVPSQWNPLLSNQ